MANSEQKKINFGAGPAKLPEEVMKRAQEEFLILPGAGVSAVEMSHRSSDYTNLYNQAVQLLRDEMSVPNEFEVFFMHGGASGQFAAVPLNLKGTHKSADYAITGRWSKMAVEEGSRFISTRKVFTPPKPFVSIPPDNEWERDPDAAYLYYCANETVDGVEFKKAPETFSNVPLVADISSNILSRPFSFENHGIVLSSTQKNLGAAGLTTVMVRKDLIHNGDSNVPSILSYYQMQKTNSNYNTPNVFGIYLTKLILEWIRDKGGVEEIYRMNQRKAGMIYDLIDSSSGFYHSPVKTEFRSLTNVPFRVGGSSGNEEMEKKFLEGAVAKGMIGLKGHRSVGGIRASLYNAVTTEETETLRDYMVEFKKKMCA